MSIPMEITLTAKINNLRYELTKKYYTIARIITHNNLDLSHKYNVEWTKSDIKKHTLNDSNYMKSHNK